MIGLILKGAGLGTSVKIAQIIFFGLGISVLIILLIIGLCYLIHKIRDNWWI